MSAEMVFLPVSGGGKPLIQAPAIQKPPIGAEVGLAVSEWVPRIAADVCLKDRSR